ncbi:Lysine-rich nucleolar protein 1 [Microtus ochrogaster]|uniref:Lysine-rich nucleolar protein 1 n=1 Tax=Microtus ochrogaster TaxID=79684 RepID=A0A8J6GTU3_MICOH|nr:Lysine-rich nucleolar protein 1 [Microtus ochrogaster]
MVTEVTEPETQYSVLNNNDYFVDVSPPRVTSPFNNVGEGQDPETSLGKRNKKKASPSAHLEEHLESEATQRGRKKSSSPRRQDREQSAECLSGEKKKKRRKSLPPATSQGSVLKTSPDPKSAEEVSKASKRPKNTGKKKRFWTLRPVLPRTLGSVRLGMLCGHAQGRQRVRSRWPWGRKGSRGAPESTAQREKKKKTHQEGDMLPIHSKRSVESSLKKGSKKSLKSEVLDYIPIDSPKSHGKKKVKSKKKVEQPDGEGLAVKRKKKKRKDSGVKEDRWQEEEEESDTDLEVVLEKRGNMDEACIDQVRRKALQEEIDQQKLKFLNLMGGFKHLSPSFSRPPSMTSRHNMALDKKSSDTLQQNLQQDYDRAMSWKSSRGAGLGFSSEARKVFYVDQNASKSIKLQD